MEKDKISIIMALKDALKQRDSLASSLIDDNISLQLQLRRFKNEIFQYQQTLDITVDSLRNTTFGVTTPGMDALRTLVLINNGIKGLTGAKDLDKSVIKSEEK